MEIGAQKPNKYMEACGLCQQKAQTLPAARDETPVTAPQLFRPVENNSKNKLDNLYNKHYHSPLISGKNG